MKQRLFHILAILALPGVSGCVSDEIIIPDPGTGEIPPNNDPDDGKPEKNNDYFIYGLADIDIRTDKGVAVDSKDPADYRPCTVKVDGNDVFPDYEGRAQIRGRGNSTWWWYDKKPYRIKLDEASRFLEMKENRDWVLMADYRDVTHMMNNVGFSMAHYLEIPYTNHARYATVTLNGKYLGLYMVTEQVEEGGHRVELDADTGLLIALDINDGPSDVPDATNNYYSEVFGMASAVKYPRDCTVSQQNVAKNEFAKLEKAIKSLEWSQIDAVLDVKAMIDYLLVEELIGNVELNNRPSTRSVYINRHDSKSKWIMGPVWDCDGGFSYNWGDMYDEWGYGHTYFENYKYLIYGYDPYRHRGWNGAGVSDFFADLFGVPEFVSAYKERWNAVKDGLFDCVLKNIDLTEDVIAEAAQEDMDLWGIGNYKHKTEVKSLKTWLANRFSYLDGIINAYPDPSGGSPSDYPDLDNATVKGSLSLEASYPMDEHHFGAFITLSGQDQKAIADAIGIPYSSLADEYERGLVAFVAVEPDGTLNPDNTANAPGHWFDPDGWVTPYGQNSFVYSEMDMWYGGFNVGKHPYLCVPGTYTFAQALVKGTSAMKFQFTVTVTEP